MFSIFKTKKTPKNNTLNGITARTPTELLAPLQHLINQIEQSTGVPQNHWQQNYIDFIHNFAMKVQLLPASESHHHSSYGGLLEHSLETGLNALKLKRAKMLPVGANAEVIEKEKELWNYAVFTAALLHDVGKPLSDQNISVFSGDTLRKFNPVTEFLNVGDIYQLEFRRGRKYRSHENLPLLLASSLIPKVGLNWITSNPDILDEWTMCLTGRKSESESIGEIITKADQISTAQNLTGHANVATPAAKTTPLHKRLKTALIYLLDNDELPLNRQGAAGWIFNETLWLMSKRGIDEIRKHMRQEGQTGIPSDNTRIMDELSQHNVIKVAENDLANWKMNVYVGSWKNQFSLLCIPLKNIWPDVSAWPAISNEVKVLPLESKETVVNNDEPQAQASINNEEDRNKEVLNPHAEKNANNSHKSENTIQSDNIDLPLPPGISLPESETLTDPDNEGETNVVTDKVEENSIDLTSAPIVNKRKEVDNHSAPVDTLMGEAFLHWMSSGIADGSITINQQQAMAHIIGENKDLILVSPKIFRVYASKRNIDYKEVQRNFQLLELHSLNETKNIWSFKTLTKRTNKDSGKLSGMLIRNAEEKLGIRLPPQNSHVDYL